MARDRTLPWLTKETVDEFKGDRLRDVFAWDSDVRGFEVRLKPSRTKIFPILYMNAEG